MVRNFLSLLILVVFINFNANAQHPLTGTWEMVSIAGVNADGEKFTLDTTTIRETKIITPTHYILIAQHKEGGVWKFNRCYSGQVKVESDKYYEIPMMSSERIFQNVTTDFKWKIEGNQFIQSGTITRPDGKTIILDKFVFNRTAHAPAVNQKLVGTWQLNAANVKSLFIVNATHWMMIEQQDEKFTRAVGGVYSVKGNKAELKVLYGSENLKMINAELKGQTINLENKVYSKIN